MSLWLFVSVGILIVIAIIVVMKADSGAMRSFKNKTKLITNVTYICSHCGNSFKGAQCPTCGSNSWQGEVGSV